MRINIKKIIVFLLVTILLFQDSITEVVGISYLNYIDEIFIVALLFVALIKSRGKIPFIAVKILLIAITFFIIGTVYCIIFSEYTFKILILSGFLSIKFFLIVAAVVILRPKDEIIKYIKKSLKILGFISALTGLFNFLFPEIWVSIIPYAWVEWRLGIPAALGLFIHPGQYGWFMLFVAILYYSEFKITKDKKKLCAFIIYAVLSITSIKIKVIAGIVCVLFVDLFIVDRKRIRSSKFIALGGSIIATLVVFGNYLFENISKYILGTTTEVSARYVLLNRSLNILWDYFPFGVGFGKFGSWYARVNYSEYYYKYDCDKVYGLEPSNPKFATDTFWPSVIGETGIFGTIIYIYFLVYVIKNQLKIISDYTKSAFARGVAHFGFLVLVQSIVETMGEAAFNSSPQNIFVGFMVGLALCMGLKKNNETQCVFEEV